MKTTIKFTLVLSLLLSIFIRSSAQTPSYISFLGSEADQYDPWEVVTKAITVPVGVPITVTYNLYTYDTFDITADNVVRVSRNTPTSSATSITIASTTGVIYVHWSWCGSYNPSTVFTVNSVAYTTFENIYSKNDLSIAGNLGVGTSMPTTILQVKKGDASTNLSFSNTSAIDLWNPSSTINSGGQINFRSDAGTTPKSIGAVIGYLNKSTSVGGSAGNLVFGVKSIPNTASAIQAMTIAMGGNVLIGKTTDDNVNKLQVNGSILSAGSISSNGNIVSNASSDQIQLQSYTSVGKTWRLGTSIGSSGANRNFTIWESDLGNALTINQANGNVGIGTVTSQPIGKLSVYSGTYQSGFLGGLSSPDAGSIFYATDDTGWKFNIGKYANNTYTKQFTIKDNGYVGIGIVDPQETLHLNGNIRGNASGGALRVQTPTGYLDLGSMNSDWTHIYTDRRNIIMNTPVWSIAGEFSAYDLSNLKLQTNGTTRMLIQQSNGFVGIGTTTPDALLSVKGTIHAQEVVVDLCSGLADFVFHPTYNLMPLTQVEQYVKTNSHLPEMPSAAEVSKNGMNMGEMQNKLLQKVEELTLYIIEQQKRIEAQGTQINELKAALKK